MYEFEPGEAFELFYEGVVKLLHSRSPEDIPEITRLFDKSIEKCPENKYSRIYRNIAIGGVPDE